MLSGLRRLDVYPKTIEEFSVRTYSGAVLTIISGLIIFILVVGELSYFLATERHDRLDVDTTRGERLTIHFNITFPRIACDILTLDAVDVSGEQQVAIDHNIIKTRIDENGNRVVSLGEAKLGEDEASVEKAKAALATPGKDYCGSCYGAEQSPGDCCNTCEEVRAAYQRNGWAFYPNESVEQCFREILQRRMRGNIIEGCNIDGRLQVNRLAGNFHLSPGRSFQLLHAASGASQTSELDVTHTIHTMAFGEEFPGQKNPLDNIHRPTSGGLEVFQYFVKVVPTSYSSSRRSYKTNQYSVTEHVRKLGANTIARGIMPGVFFIYDLSPISVHIKEDSRSFLQFLTSVCAVVGGVITISSIVDKLLYNLLKKLEKDHNLGKPS